MKIICSLTYIILTLTNCRAINTSFGSVLIQDRSWLLSLPGSHSIIYMQGCHQEYIPLFISLLSARTNEEENAGSSWVNEWQLFHPFCQTSMMGVNLLCWPRSYVSLIDRTHSVGQHMRFLLWHYATKRSIQAGWPCWVISGWSFLLCIN